MEACGLVCTGGGMIFAAEENERAIYRFDENLLLSGVYAGGPGMRSLCVTADGERLYVLLSDADSVLMLSAGDGLPMFLARAGVNPQSMHLDESGKCMVIAGGKDGSALMLCPHTLRQLHVVWEEGICVDALLCGDTLCMLLLDGTMNARLILRYGEARRRMFCLCGMPGSLYAAENELLVCAGEYVYVFDVQAMCMKGKLPAGGACGKLFAAEKQLLLLSPLQEKLYSFHGKGWNLLCRGVLHACTMG